jgi:tetratricopeptide (TPR) repeat protein
LRVAGTYFRDRGDPDHAEAYFQELIDLAEPLHERSWLAESRLGLGLLAEDQNRYPEAIDQMHKSLLLYAELGFQQMVGVLHKHLGLLYAALNQFSTAFDHFRRQLELFKKIGVQWRMVEGYMSLGETRLLMGSLEEAQRYYALALQSFREVEDGSPIGAYLAGELGWLATVEQDYGHALARFLPAFHANQQVYPDHMIPSFMSRAIPLLEAFDKTALAEKAAAFVVYGRVNVQLNTRRPAIQFMEKIKAEKGVEAHDGLVIRAGQIKQARLQAEFEETLIAIGEKIGI